MHAINRVGKRNKEGMSHRQATNGCASTDSTAVPANPQEPPRATRAWCPSLIPPNNIFKCKPGRKQTQGACDTSNHTKITLPCCFGHALLAEQKEKKIACLLTSARSSRDPARLPALLRIRIPPRFDAALPVRGHTDCEVGLDLL